jgi:hypothetical protein
MSEKVALITGINGQYRKPSSNKKLLSIIGEYNFTTLEIGLKESID